MPRHGFLVLALRLLPLVLALSTSVRADPHLRADAEDTLSISDTFSGRGTVVLQIRPEGQGAWISQGEKALASSGRRLDWRLPRYRVPGTQDTFYAYRFVAREGPGRRLLYDGREFRGPMSVAPVPEFSPAVEGFTLTYFLLDPRAVEVTLQVWDPVVGANLFGGGRWVTVYSRRHPAGQAGRVTERIASPFSAFDVGRASSYRLMVSYGREPIKWRESALFAVAGTSWLTYGAVAALLLLGGGAWTALWPLVRSRARLQEELRLAEVRSQARQRGMTLLASKIGHEAEAWMASIRWLSALLRRELRESSRASEYVAELERASDQLGAYLLRLKEYGRPSSPARSPVRIGEALRMARLRAEHALQETNVTVTERCLEDGWLMGDESELVSALGNLIQNAAEAMAQSEPRELILTTRAVGRDQIAVEVRDTGHGIVPAIVESLFDPFRSTRGEGRGLGLAIARKNVEAHGGTISCRPEPDGGTTFVVTLPCRPDMPAAETADPSPNGTRNETADARR